MRKCPNCGANLLNATIDCPICQLPDGGKQLTRDSPRAAAEARSGKTWLLILIGVFIPPLGLLFLLMYLAIKLTPNAPDAQEN